MKNKTEISNDIINEIISDEFTIYEEILIYIRLIDEEMTACEGIFEAVFFYEKIFIESGENNFFSVDFLSFFCDEYVNENDYLSLKDGNKLEMFTKEGENEESRYYHKLICEIIVSPYEYLQDVDLKQCLTNNEKKYINEKYNVIYTDKQNTELQYIDEENIKEFYYQIINYDWKVLKEVGKLWFGKGQYQTNKYFFDTKSDKTQSYFFDNEKMYCSFINSMDLHSCKESCICEEYDRIKIITENKYNEKEQYKNNNIAKYSFWNIYDVDKGINLQCIIKPIYDAFNDTLYIHNAVNKYRLENNDNRDITEWEKSITKNKRLVFPEQRKEIISAFYNEMEKEYILSEYKYFISEDIKDRLWEIINNGGIDNFEKYSEISYILGDSIVIKNKDEYRNVIGQNRERQRYLFEFITAENSESERRTTNIIKELEKRELKNEEQIKNILKRNKDIEKEIKDKMPKENTQIQKMTYAFKNMFLAEK